MAVRSQFVYDRSIVDDVADVLAQARDRCWSEIQRVTLDWVIREFMESAFEYDDSFDVERFASRARYCHDRVSVVAPDTTTPT